MSTVVGVIIAALAALAAVLGKLWHSAATERDLAKAERDAQAGARTDDASRFESVIASKNQDETTMRLNVPKDTAGVREDVKNLGGVPLPDEVTKPGGKS